MPEIIHKNLPPKNPLLSLILLDWGVRERFTTLDWLNKQDVARDQYEIIWVELYDRVVDEVMEKADIVITCNQRGTYHKHLGYNIGLLKSHGELVCVCDSDAVFPQDFVSSVFQSFDIESEGVTKPLVLMHYEWRTSLLYPEDLNDAELLKDQERWNWWPLIVNEGACVTVRRADAIRFGGFDEHRSYIGYLCGPYDLAWRLVNAGWQEVWHDSSVALWHFAHPDPIGTNGQKASLRQLMEKAYPHLEGHALTAVEAFSTGRFQPLQENSKIWALRMADRLIGSELEVRYSNKSSQSGFSRWKVWKLWISLILEVWREYTEWRLWRPGRKILRLIVGAYIYRILGKIFSRYSLIVKLALLGHAEQPTLLTVYGSYNIIKLHDLFYAARHDLGQLDLMTEEGRAHPGLLSSAGYRALLRKVKQLSKQTS